MEELGLLKMDFLGLRNLSVIHDAEEMIRRKNPGFSVEGIDYQDAKVFHMLSSGNVDGVFQFESGGMRSVIMQLKPEHLEDSDCGNFPLSAYAVNPSVYRMPPQSGKGYLEASSSGTHSECYLRMYCLSGAGDADLPQPCRVFFGEEQILVRRAMAKKKAKVMEEEKQVFIHGLLAPDGSVEVDGCIRRGVDEKTALEIFGEMESFRSGCL